MNQPPPPPLAASHATRLFPDHRWSFASVPGAASLDEDSLSDAVLRAYREIFANAEHGLHVVRMWNFIPRLLDDYASGRNRYMAFNSGRYEALCQALGGAPQLADRAPAASGVGTTSADLSIHALLVPEPGVAVHNQSQVDPMTYSARFGPKPPCFSRAMRVGRTLLVSGTASIAGEESVCEGNLDEQFDVTIQNLSRVIQAGFGLRPAWIRLLESVRVYYSRTGDLKPLTELYASMPLTKQAVEFIHVDLCRRELLVEIEGVAVESSDHA